MAYQNSLVGSIDTIIKQANALKEQGMLKEDLARIDAELKIWRSEIFARTPNCQEFSEDETNTIIKLVEEWQKKNKQLLL